MSPTKQTPSQRRRRGGIVLMGEIGAYSVLFTGGGLVVGILLDRALHMVLFLIIGVLGGFGATMFKIVRVALRELED